jgi:hypothetical protein
MQNSSFYPSTRSQKITRSQYDTSIVSLMRRGRKDRRIQETGYPCQVRHCGMILMRFSDARVSFLHEWLCEGSLPSFKPGKPRMSGERVVNQIDSLPIFSFAECLRCFDEGNVHVRISWSPSGHWRSKRYFRQRGMASSSSRGLRRK